MILLAPTIGIIPFAIPPLYVHICLKIRGVEQTGHCKLAGLRGNEYNCTYNYTDKDGISHYESVNVPKIPDHVQAGDPLDIVYDARKPARSRPAFSLSRLIPWKWSNVMHFAIVQCACAYMAGARVLAG
ncbi:hypothetical protein [Streptomyces sp. NPDC088261]|uniref:hypothetical protein n=1 Tax=Streptomyces sp. NPDC088261 TaxID=3365851 RepID=UPI0038222F99